MRGDAAEEAEQEAARPARYVAGRRGEQCPAQEIEDHREIGMSFLQLREQRRDVHLDPTEIGQGEQFGAAGRTQVGMHRLRAHDVLGPQHADELAVRPVGAANVRPRHRPPGAAQRRGFAEHGFGAVGRGGGCAADDQHDVAVEQDGERAVHRSGCRCGRRRIGGGLRQVQTRTSSHADCAPRRSSSAL